MQQTHKIDWAAVKANVAAKKITREATEMYGPLFRSAALRPVFTAEEILDAAKTLPQVPEQSALEAELNQLLAVAEVVSNPDGSKQWRIKDDLRQKVMADFGTLNQAQQYLPPNAAQSTDARQRLLALYIIGEAPALEVQTLPELNASASVANWLSAYTSNGIPRAENVQAELKRKELIAPFQNITTHFLGRTKELVTLVAFMAQQPQEFDPQAVRYGQTSLHSFSMMVYGIGGAGKTTIVAKFILDQLRDQADSGFGFAYFDFDRPDVRLEPLQLLDEMVRQFQLQQPSEAELLQSLRQGWQSQLGNSTRGYERDFYLDRLGAWWNSRNPMRPLLLVFDSFEEVQNWVSAADRDNLLRFLIDLKRVIPNLKVVISGRANVDYFDMQPLEIGDFDEAAALGYLYAKGVTKETCAREIWQHVGGNPLDLKLAAAEALKTGCENLPTLLRSIDKKRLREVLFHRQLEHIHDPRVRALALPGMVVRMVNAEVIREVLAGPCGLIDISPEIAGQLMDGLQKEAFLVQYEQGNWRFRPDLRSQLIDLFALENPARTRMVHDQAVIFYANKTDPASQAEWVYHRLKRGDAPESLGELNLSALESFLRYSVTELPAAARVMLATAFGQEIPSDIMHNLVELPLWESGMAQTIQNSFVTAEADFLERLADGDLTKRSERSPNSPLLLAEAQLYERLGRLDQAERIALIALHDAKKAMDAEKALQATFRLLSLMDRHAAYDAILPLAQKAFSDAADADLTLYACRAALLALRTHARLGTLTEELAADQLAELQTQDFSTTTINAAGSLLQDLLPENFFSRGLLRVSTKKATVIQQPPEENAPFPFSRLKSAVLERLIFSWSSAPYFEKNQIRLQQNAPGMEELETCSMVRLNRPLREICTGGVWEICTHDLALFAEKEDLMNRMLDEDSITARFDNINKGSTPNTNDIPNALPPDPPAKAPLETFSVSGMLQVLSSNQSQGSKKGLKEEVQQLVADGQMEEAIQRLSDFASTTESTSFKNELLQYTARYKSLSRNNTIGLISSDDFKREQVLITYGLLELVGKLSDQASINVATAELSDLFITTASTIEKYNHIISDSNSFETYAWLVEALKNSQSVGLSIGLSNPESVVFWIQEEAFTKGVMAMSANKKPDDLPKSARYEFNFHNFKGALVARRTFELVTPFVSHDALQFLITGYTGDTPPLPLRLDTSQALQTGQTASVMTIVDKKTILAAATIQVIGDNTFELELEDLKNTLELKPGSPVFDMNWKVIGMIQSGTTAVSMAAIAGLLTNKQPTEAPLTNAGSEPEIIENPSNNLLASQFLLVYDEKDENHAQQLRKHLMLLIRMNKMRLHSLHSDATGGEDPWRRADDILKLTDYVVCLVTANFLTGRALEYAQKSGKKLIPIKVEVVDVNGTGLENLQWLPTKGQAISNYEQKDVAYAEVATDIQRLLPK